MHKDVPHGIPNLRQHVARNCQEVCHLHQRAVALQVTTHSAKDAELPIEEADLEAADEATEAPNCAPLLLVEAS